MSEAAQNAGAIIIGVIILLGLLIRFAASGGTMRRKDVERNTQAALRAGYARRAAREQLQAQAAVERALREWERNNQGEGGNTR